MLARIAPLRYWQLANMLRSLGLDYTDIRSSKPVGICDYCRFNYGITTGTPPFLFLFLIYFIYAQITLSIRRVHLWRDRKVKHCVLILRGVFRALNSNISSSGKIYKALKTVILQVSKQ